jgi:tryptophan-rich sensory protein
MTTIELILGAIGWLAITFGAAWLGSRFLPDEWYKNLKKPKWNPPNKIFAPVWSVLYLLMAVAAWSVWKSYGFSAVSFALVLYVVQLLLNAAWTWTFFGLHRPGVALGDIVVLWVFILATLTLFWQFVPLSGVLLLPYLAWVTFAAYLNLTIWRMNRLSQ